MSDDDEDDEADGDVDDDDDESMRVESAPPSRQSHRAVKASGSDHTGARIERAASAAQKHSPAVTYWKCEA